MWYETNDLSIYVFYFSLGIFIIGLYFFLIKPLIFTTSRLSFEERLSLWGAILLVFIILFSAIVMQCIKWCLELLGNKSVFLCQNADEARVVYETRCILGYAETIAVTSISIFIPLLVMLWNRSKQVLSDTLKDLLNLRSNPRINPRALEEMISELHSCLSEVIDMGNSLRPLFLITILVGVLFILSLGYSNVSQWDSLQLYLFVVCQKTFAMIFLIWFITLLIIYQISIQPIIREYRHLHLFNLEDL